MNISAHQEHPEGPRVEVLTEEQCLELLEQARFARLATVDPEGSGYVDITPVNILAADGKVYFRTAAGKKLTTLQLNPRATVEFDAVAGNIAHSVVVRGLARVVTDSAELEHLAALPLRPWLHTTKLEFVEIDPVLVTGRRFRLGE